MKVSGYYTHGDYKGFVGDVEGADFRGEMKFPTEEEYRKYLKEEKDEDG